jgi:hypothetical protein
MADTARPALIRASPSIKRGGWFGDHIIVFQPQNIARDRRFDMVTGTAANSDWVVEVGKGVIALIFGFIGGVALEQYKARKSRYARAAAFFMAIAEGLEGMVASFGRFDIPHKEGHLIDTLIEAFDETTRKLIDEDMIPKLKELSRLASQAEDFDQLFESGQIAAHENGLQGWMADAERLAGDLRGKAAILLTK